MPDPWGFGIEAFEEVYIQIEQAVNGLISYFANTVRKVG